MKNIVSVKFSLIELLIVLVLVIGILFFLLMGSRGKASKRALNLQCKSHLEGIGEAIAFYTDSGSNQTKLTELKGANDPLNLLKEAGLVTTRMMFCPVADIACEYQFNREWSGKRERKTWLIKDSKEHNDGNADGNFLFGDMKTVGDEIDWKKASSTAKSPWGDMFTP